jgi:threonine/homoserine/homoserine lactone efflux protein
LRILGAVAGFFLVDFIIHLIDALAFGMKAETQVERIGAVLFGIFVLLVLMVVFYRLFSKAFFNGFTVATGLFLSFDIVVFHWIFQLHRITSGPEANWLEPILVVGGIIMIWFGIKMERSMKKIQPKD